MSGFLIFTRPYFFLEGFLTLAGLESTFRQVAGIT